MLSKSISSRLLTRVLSVYFVLTFFVTCGQLLASYHNSKVLIQDELLTLQNVFSDSLTRSIWELNSEQTDSITKGLFAIPSVTGVIIRDDSGEVIAQMGQSIKIIERFESQLVQEAVHLQMGSGLFGYTFPLIFTFSEQQRLIGDVTLISSRHVVFERIKVSFYFLFGNALIKTTFLIILFLLAFRRLLTVPLTELTQQIEEVEPDELDGVQINIATTENNELKIVEQSFNNLIDKVNSYKQQLESTQKKLVKSNEKLDKQNMMLGLEVARKTSNLSRVMIDLQQQKYQLEKQKRILTEEVERRKKTANELLLKQHELTQYVDELNQAQQQLVGSEKMASLGGLVAGITHDIDTSIGIGVTALSFLETRLAELEADYNNKVLSSNILERFIADTKQTVQLIYTNLERTSELITSFKQISVDQTSEAVRTINFKDYLDEIIRSLYPNLKQTSHTINLNCRNDLILNLPAGAISQIFTNLIMNSVIHGFSGITNGIIDISVSEQGNDIVIVFKDNGSGLSDEQLEYLFDPFFTTRRAQGGSGLGTHIVYNLVKQTLFGNITASSEHGHGLCYTITFAKDTFNTKILPFAD